LQDPEHGVYSKFVKISFAVERIDGTEPLRDTAVVASELILLLEELVHLDESHGLSIEKHPLFLVA
jgi:hypothetical protein